jgi:hypothetical protein
MTGGNMTTGGSMGGAAGNSSGYDSRDDGGWG